MNILDKYKFTSDYSAIPSSSYLLGSANNANPMVLKSQSQNQGLLDLSSNSNPMMGLLGNPLFAIGTALLNPRQSFGQNLQQGFQNLMQQQMYKQEQERKNRADIIKLAPLIKQQQIQNILADGITNESIAEASKIDPILTGKIVKSATESAQNTMRLKALQGGQPLVNAGDIAYNYGFSAGLTPGQLTAAKALGDSIRTGQLDPTSLEGISQITQVNNQIESMIQRDFQRKLETDRFGITERKESRGATSEQNSFMLADNALNAANNILKIVKENPDAGVPGYGAEIATNIFGDLIGRKFKSEDRKIIEDSQRQFIDAVLTLGTGAAYNEYQLEGAKVTYFPQPGDGEKARLIKQQSLINAIDAAINRTGALEPKIKPKLEKLKKLIQDSYTPKPTNQPIEDKNKKLRNLLGGS